MHNYDSALLTISESEILLCHTDTAAGLRSLVGIHKSDLHIVNRDGPVHWQRVDVPPLDSKLQFHQIGSHLDTYTTVGKKIGHSYYNSHAMSTVGDISFRSIMPHKPAYNVIFYRNSNMQFVCYEQGQYLSAVHGVCEFFGESLVVVRMKVREKVARTARDGAMPEGIHHKACPCMGGIHERESRQF